MIYLLTLNNDPDFVTPFDDLDALLDALAHILPDGETFAVTIEREAP